MEIAVETHRVLTIKSRGRCTLAWCPECGKQVSMITPDQAAALTNLSARGIYRQVEIGLIHYLETPGGFLLICSKSIARLATKPR